MSFEDKRAKRLKAVAMGHIDYSKDHLASITAGNGGIQFIPKTSWIRVFFTLGLSTGAAVASAGLVAVSSLALNGVREMLKARRNGSGQEQAQSKPLPPASLVKQAA